jgi:hypothetical protein
MEKTSMLADVSTEMEGTTMPTFDSYVEAMGTSPQNIELDLKTFD